MKCESCGYDNLDDAHFCASCGVQLSHQPEDSWIGRLVGGRFRVTQVLGEGGMGVVYAAEQQMGTAVRRAAIKTLHSHLSKDPSVLARFHRECGTVAQLEHPHTIKVFDFGSDEDGTLYIAMEFVEGRGLDKLIELEAPLAPARVVDILDQVCGALDEAHEQGIVHRDLKPENVILGEKLGKSDFVKVLDFGIAARSESSDSQKEQKLTQQGMVLGTPPYMSPEQFTGEELSRRSDVYSLAVMAYEMLTGTLPFEANTPWQWATEHMTAQPFPIEQRPSGVGVPPTMREAVMQALSKNPEDRPKTAGAFGRSLREGLVGVSPVQTAPTEAMQAVPPGAAPTGEQPQVGRSPAADPAAASPLGTPAGAGAVGGSMAQAKEVGTETSMAAASTPQLPRKSSMPLVVAGAALLALVGGAAAYWGTGSSSAVEEEEEQDALAEQEDSEEAPEGVAPSETELAGRPEPHGTDSSSPPAAPPSPRTDSSGSEEPQAAPQPQPSGSNPQKNGSQKGSPSSGTNASNPKQDPPEENHSHGASQEPSVDCRRRCLSQIDAGSWTQASRTYAGCSAADQKQCTAQALRAAARQARQASQAGQCSKVRSIASASRKMGAFSSRVKQALEKCK